MTVHVREYWTFCPLPHEQDGRGENFGSFQFTPPLHISSKFMFHSISHLFPCSFVNFRRIRAVKQTKSAYASVERRISLIYSPPCVCVRARAAVDQHLLQPHRTYSSPLCECQHTWRLLTSFAENVRECCEPENNTACIRDINMEVCGQTRKRKIFRISAAIQILFLVVFPCDKSCVD